MKGKFIDIEELLKDYVPDPKQQAVFVYLNFPLGKTNNKKTLDAIFELQDILWKIIETTKVGKFDGNEFCESPTEDSVTFFMYGDSADVIYETIEPILTMLPSLPGSYVIKRYGGDVGATQIKIPLT